MNDIEAALRKCDGGGLCRAEIHIHGCYSDKGSCNRPSAHGTAPQHATKEK